MSETEDWSIVHGSPRCVHGGPLISQQCVQLFEPEELIIWEMLYQTVVDCHKVATGKWEHFRPMRWHEHYDAARIMITAKQKLSEWIESETFQDYLHLLGWNPQKALIGLREVLRGNRADEVEDLIRQIAKERDARRNRGVSTNE